MSALCFEERERESCQIALLSSKLALVPAGARPGQWGHRRAVLCWLPFWAYRVPPHYPVEKGNCPEREEQILRWTFCTGYIFLTGKRSICIKMILPPGKLVCWPSVTFSHLENCSFLSQSFVSVGARVVMICHLS